MKLTTKGRYAVTAMLDLSINHSESAITLSNISERQGISLSYLEQLFSKLRKNDLVSSTRGPGGGYRLSRPADEITVLDVILAVDENVDTRACKGKADCNNNKKCLCHKLWESLSAQIQGYLDSITLAQVVTDFNNDSDCKKAVDFLT